MDESKLRNSCICGNTKPYLECCGRYADPLAASPESGEAVPLSKQGRSDAEAFAYHAFRHTLHELSMALFPLRALYQVYWEKLGKEEYPHDTLMEDPDYGRAIVENFFWDHFVQYSDARPILRTARELEAKELRLAHDLMQWSFSPLWFFRIQERNALTARVINVGNQKTHVLYHGGRFPEAGDGVLTRILPFRGREFCGHTVLGIKQGAMSPKAEANSQLEALFRAGCRDLGVKPSVTLRPDVHCDEWRRHGAVFLALWRAEMYDSKVGRPIRGSNSSSIFNLTLRSRDALLAVLGANPDVRFAGENQWDFRYRALRIARLELNGGNLIVTVTDPAFKAYAKDWLNDRLAGAVHVADESLEAMPGESSESQDMWVHTPLDALNGQTPIQASGHDWGRMRMQFILKDMIKSGRDVMSLRKQLGL